MEYKKGDLVYFDDYDQKGVGKVVVVDNSPKTYLVHSTDIVGGHDYGESMEAKQDNDNNWWFVEGELRPFEKKVGQKYKVIRDDCHNFIVGDIATLTNLHEDGTSIYKTEYEEWFLYDIDHENCEVEFYADVEDAEEHKENKMFTKEDLKAGYLVKIRDGRFAHIVDTAKEGLCLNYVESWSHTSYYNNDLTYKGRCESDIIEVYGLTAFGYNAHKFEVEDRKLLWKRGEGIKESTIKALGAIDKAIEEQTIISGELGIKVEHLGESDKQYILEEGFNCMEDVNGGFIIYKCFDGDEYEEEF